MRLFFSATKSRTIRDMELLDGESGEALKMLIPVTAQCIMRNGGRYWTLRVTNLGTGRARCRLRINYAEDAIIRFSDGLRVSMAAPPADERTIATLVDRLFASDPETQRLASAALLVVGRPAMGALSEAMARPNGSRASRLIARMGERL